MPLASREDDGLPTKRLVVPPAAGLGATGRKSLLPCPARAALQCTQSPPHGLPTPAVPRHNRGNHGRHDRNLSTRGAGRLERPARGGGFLGTLVRTLP